MSRVRVLRKEVASIRKGYELLLSRIDKFERRDNSFRDRPCTQCGAPFRPPKTGGGRARICSEESRKAARWIASRRGRKNAKAKRRAVERGARAERIDVLKVFDRDRWRCHICGIKTMKSKRGTCHPKAPELDHIVTLADGGSHTWGNVACACRSCNQAKGARSFGQLGLGVAA
jgi:5-methylcytosine-specific restriction endonuclease McrA